MALLLQVALISVLSTFLWAFALVSIKPSDRLQRGLILLLTSSAAGQIQYGNPDLTGNSIYNGLFLSWIWIFHFRAFDLLFWTEGGVHVTSQMASKLQGKPSSTAQSVAAQYLTAWSLIFNVRNVNTPWAVKSLPSSTSHYFHSRRSFVTRRVAHFVGIYLLLDTMFTFLPPVNPDVDVPEYKQYIFSRINDVSFEEFITRPLTVIGPALGIYGIFSAIYDIASVIAVLCFNDNPTSWPPLFGNLSEGYTLRKFWGVAWHQTFRSFAEANSSFITSKILCVNPQRYRLFSRCIRLFLAFFISALVHIPGNVALGVNIFATGAPRFFLMQAVGIVIEDAFFYMYRHLKLHTPRKMSSGGLVFLGYLWTLAWLTWTGPSFFWVTARNLVPRGDETIPWSVLQWFGLG